MTVARRRPAAGFRMGHWRVFPELHRVQRDPDGDGVEPPSRHLDPQAMAVLQALAGAAPHVLSSAELLATAWAGRVVTENSVHRVIAQLRKALGDNKRSPKFIETIPRRGYRLLAEIAPLTAGENGNRHPGPLQVAVARLQALGPGGPVQWMADGCTQDILAALADLPGITVFAESTDLTPDLLLTGSVRQQDKHTRISLQLVDPARQQQLWATGIDHAGDTGLIDLQDQVALAVRHAVRAQLPAGEHETT